MFAFAHQRDQRTPITSRHIVGPRLVHYMKTEMKGLLEQGRNTLRAVPPPRTPEFTSVVGRPGHFSLLIKLLNLMICFLRFYVKRQSLFSLSYVCPLCVLCLSSVYPLSFLCPPSVFCPSSVLFVALWSAGPLSKVDVATLLKAGFGLFQKISWI